jgi:hypothetical protein
MILIKRVQWDLNHSIKWGQIIQSYYTQAQMKFINLDLDYISI